MNEIEDTVAASIQAGDEIGPCYRALRRNTGGQAAERSLLGQAREVRHLPFRHELGEQVGIEAVYAEDNYLLRIGSSLNAAAREKRERTRHAEREQADEPNPFSYRHNHLIFGPVYGGGTESAPESRCPRMTYLISKDRVWKTGICGLGGHLWSGRLFLGGTGKRKSDYYFCIMLLLTGGTL